MRRIWRRFTGKPAYRPGTLYRAHRQQWQPVGVLDALSISLHYGFEAVAWGRW